MAFVLDPAQTRRWSSALNRLRRKVIIQENEVPMRSSVDYVNRVRMNITTQKYSGYYAPYNPRYSTWKNEHFPGSRGYWHLRGFLQMALRPFKVKGGWMGGVRSEIMVPGSSWFGEGYSGPGISIAQYGRWMEYGRRGQPPRPLFGFTLEEFKMHGWPKVISRATRIMKGAWR